MATDYDAPRKSEEDQSEESIEELKARRHDKNSGKVDEDEAEVEALLLTPDYVDYRLMPEPLTG